MIDAKCALNWKGIFSIKKFILIISLI